MSNNDFNPNEPEKFILPARFIEQCKEFSHNGSFLYIFLNEAGEFEVQSNFYSNSDFFALMTQTQVYTGANLGAGAKFLAEDILEGLSGDSPDEEE